MPPRHPARLARGLAVSSSLLFVTAPIVAQEHEEYSRPVDRRFTFVEESLHGAPPGHFEFEQWVTWAHGTRIDSGLDRIDFKHELEYGISDRLHFAIDIAEWHTTDESGDWHSKYDLTAAELKWRFADPRGEGLGVGFKTELGFGPHDIEWENVLILDKITGRWEFGYNLELQAGFEGEKTFEVEESELAVVQSLGASYEFEPTLFCGGEFVYEIPPDWSWGDRQNFFIGPNVAVRGPDCALTTTAMFLADGEATAPEFQLRFLFEVDF